MTVHLESTPHLHRILSQIRDFGCQVGVSLNPSTPLSSLEEVIGMLDLVLVMSVNPGFGGQKFIESSLSKIERLVQLRQEHTFLIEVDGGVNEGNIHRLQAAGAEVLVVGSGLFAKKNRIQATQEFKSLLAQGLLVKET